MLANAAVPVLFPQPWLMALALVPVVWVELTILRPRIPVRVIDVLAANVVSTLCGLPVAFVATGVFGMVLGGDDPGLGSLGWSGKIVTDELNNWWILPSAMMAVIVPCFILSILVEGWLLARRIKPQGRGALWRSVTRAHVFSYLVLLAVDCLWFALKAPK